MNEDNNAKKLRELVRDLGHCENSFEMAVRAAEQAKAVHESNVHQARRARQKALDDLEEFTRKLLGKSGGIGQVENK